MSRPGGDLGQFGPYRLIARLGEGGMGVVYRAWDANLERAVALKLLRDDLRHDDEARARFLREARAAAAVRSDHVVTTFQVGEDNGVPYMVMELLEGMSLDEFIVRQKPLTPRDVARIGYETALGLAAAHDRGLIHRDIKPANLWLETPGGRVKILDFGLAMPTGDIERLTSTGVVLGTPAYMSPEQARDDHLDARSDLFSLGSVLFRLLAGRLPFPGANTMAVLTALAIETPPPVRSLAPETPEPLAKVIDQLLAKRPADRPQTAAEVARRLADIDAVPPPPPPPADTTPLPPSRPNDWRELVQIPADAPPRKRRRWLAPTLMIVAMLAATAAVVRYVDPEGKVLAGLWAEVRSNDDRVRWVRIDGKGHFERLPNGSWVEVAADRGGGPFPLREAESSSSAIVLFDPKRKVTYRITVDRVEIEDDEPMHFLYSGHWEPPKKKPPG